MPISKSQQKKLTALGQRVKAIREQKGFTLEKLGELIDKERQSINRLEKGAVNPSYLYLLDICKGLQIDITDLLKGLSE
jgi:transcriptional regulator with XRE-family HTH domain